MTSDYTVLWKKDRPQRKHLRKVIVDFLGGVGTVRWKADRFFIELPGTSTNALRSNDPLTHAIDAARDKLRWIEVEPRSEKLYVVTSEADQFTLGLARSLALVLAKGWYAEFKEDH